MVAAQVSELYFTLICDMAVMDFLAAMDVGMFPPGEARRPERPVFLLSSSSSVLCQRGQRVVGGSSAIEPARPEAERIRACHTLATVNTVCINNNNN